MSLGEIIRRVRKERGLTLIELGAKIGTAHSSISQIETGAKNPSRQMLILLAQALNDNFGLDWLSEHLNGGSPAGPSKREIARNMSVAELVSLKFGGGGETRSRAQMRALAQLLDAEIAKEERVLSYPERKKK